MRKYFVAAFAILFVAGAVFGQTLTAPFVLDNITADGNGDDTSGAFPPLEGTSGWVGVANQTDSTIVISIQYFTETGVERTPAANTFALEGRTGVSWRPRGTGTDQGATGQSVPSMEIEEGDSPACSVVISWTGNSDDIRGRSIQVTSDGNMAAYALIP